MPLVHFLSYQIVRLHTRKNRTLQMISKVIDMALKNTQAVQPCLWIPFILEFPNNMRSQIAGCQSKSRWGTITNSDNNATSVLLVVNIDTAGLQAMNGKSTITSNAAQRHIDTLSHLVYTFTVPSDRINIHQQFV